MPIYEYRCSKGHLYECAEGFDAASEQTCPTCGGRSRRLISLPAVIFKGSGFYSTDNRKGSSWSDKGAGGSDSGDGAAASGDGAAASGDGAAGSGESKAEAKAAD